MLLVHHGMFWSGLQPVTGVAYDRYKDLITHDIAVYSAHLPLDMHPVLGNNILLARRLSLEPSAGFARYKSVEVGLSGSSDADTGALVQSCRELAREAGGDVVATPFDGDRRTRHWAICT